jgi:hypothetical protein
MTEAPVRVVTVLKKVEVEFLDSGEPGVRMVKREVKCQRRAVSLNSQVTGHPDQVGQ